MSLKSVDEPGTFYSVKWVCFKTGEIKYCYPLCISDLIITLVLTAEYRHSITYSICKMYYLLMVYAMSKCTICLLFILMDYCFSAAAPADSTCAASIFLQYFPPLAWFAFVGEIMEAEGSSALFCCRYWILFVYAVSILSL